MSVVLLAIGLVCVVEGLVLALAPSRMEEVLRRLAAIDPATRRMLGLGAVALGVALVGIARHFGA